MPDLFAAKDATGTTVEILTDEVTDVTLGTGQKQLIGVIDASINGTNKLVIDTAGRAKVDASGVAVPITDNGTTLSVDDGGGSLTIDGAVTVSTSPAASRATDSISAALATDAIMVGLTAIAPAFGPIAVSTSGATTIVAAQTSKKIRVLGAFWVCNGAVTVKLQSHTTTAQATGAMSFGANGGIAIPFNPVGWFETVAGEALDINLGGAVGVNGGIVYIAV